MNELVKKARHYHIADAEELFALGYTVYDLYEALVTPDKRLFVLTEPEDRTWRRDLSEVVDELNKLADEVERLNRALEQAEEIACLSIQPEREIEDHKFSAYLKTEILMGRNTNVENFPDLASWLRGRE